MLNRSLPFLLALVVAIPAIGAEPDVAPPPRSKLEVAPAPREKPAPVDVVAMLRAPANEATRVARRYEIGRAHV